MFACFEPGVIWSLLQLFVNRVRNFNVNLMPWTPLHQDAIYLCFSIAPTVPLMPAQLLFCHLKLFSSNAFCTFCTFYTFCIDSALCLVFKIKKRNKRCFAVTDLVFDFKKCVCVWQFSQQKESWIYRISFMQMYIHICMYMYINIHLYIQTYMCVTQSCQLTWVISHAECRAPYPNDKWQLCAYAALCWPVAVLAHCCLYAATFALQ